MRARVISGPVEGGVMGKSGIGAKYTEGPKLRRGTAWPRNKCGLRRITAMRDADRARLRTKRCRRKTESELQKGPFNC